MGVQHIGQVTNVHCVNVAFNHPFSNAFHRRISTMVSRS